MELEDVDARLSDDPRHFFRLCVNEHADGQHSAVWGGISGGDDAGSRRCPGNLPPRWRKYESDQIRAGRCRHCRVLWIAQAADLHQTTTSEELSQRLWKNG